MVKEENLYDQNTRHKIKNGRMKIFECVAII
jgi:hypothetical protein